MRQHDSKRLPSIATPELRVTSQDSWKRLIPEIKGDGSWTTNQKLVALVDHFKVAALAIDPTIETIWVGYDGDEFDRPFMIHIAREGSNFGRRGS